MPRNKAKGHPESLNKDGRITSVPSLQEPQALEDLTGLTELHNSAAALMMDASSEEEDESESLLGTQAPDEDDSHLRDDWLEL